MGVSNFIWENPRALQHLLTLVASSIWLSERLAARPELVDELLHESTLYSAPSREELHALVRQQLLRIPEEDLEAQMSALSRIKDGVILRVAASELTGTLPIMKVSDNLTFLAEVMIRLMHQLKLIYLLHLCLKFQLFYRYMT